MNAGDFYEHFKDALKYLGVDWGDMEQVTVSIVDGKFVMTAGNKTCTLDTGERV